MSEVEQVLGRSAPTREVVGADGRDRDPVEEAVEDHDGELLGNQFEGGGRDVLRRARKQDQALDTGADQGADAGVLVGEVASGSLEDDMGCLLYTSPSPRD